MAPTALVVCLLFLPSFFAPVVGHTALDRLPTPVGLCATKGTAQVGAPGPGHVFAPGVAGIGEKENPAMPAALQASSHVGLGF